VQAYTRRAIGTVCRASMAEAGQIDPTQRQRARDEIHRWFDLKASKNASATYRLAK
jgi:hypothetical protein